MSSERPTFDEALDGFRSFLRKEGRADRLLWITKDRVAGHRSSLWLFRPNELQADSKHRQFYDGLRKTKTSIRIDTLCELPEGMDVYVHDYGGESAYLNYGIALSQRQISFVSSRLWWLVITTYCRLVGPSPFLRNIQIPRADPAASANVRAAPCHGTS